MAVQFSMQLADGYLRFELTGSRVAGELAREMLAVWAQVADECRAKGLTRVLGVSKLTGPVPTPDMFEIASKAPPILRRAGCARVALVVSDSDAVYANRFAEDVAVNRGLTTRVFADETSALAWLTKT